MIATDELENLGKNDDTHVLSLRLSHDTIFKKFKKMELDFVLVRTPLILSFGKLVSFPG
jgi:hypothetical protein